MDEETYREILFNIDQLSTKEHVRGMRFLLKPLDGTTKKRLEECQSMLEIFEYLEKLDHAHYQKTGQLVSFLTKVFKLDTNEADPEVKELVAILSGDAEPQQKIPPAVPSQPTPVVNPRLVRQTLPQPVIDMGLTVSEKTADFSENLRLTIEYTAKHIGLNWTDFGRLAEIPETNIRDLEVANTTILEKARQIQIAYVKKNPRADHKHIRRILRKIPRNDIADELKEKIG